MLITCLDPEAVGCVLQVDLLPPDRFINGANYFSKSWPSSQAAGAAFVVHNNWADGYPAKRYRAQVFGLWRGDLVDCESYASLSDLPLPLNTQTVEVVMSRLHKFFLFVQSRNLSCAVIPEFLVASASIRVGGSLTFLFLFPVHSWPGSF